MKLTSDFPIVFVSKQEWDDVEQLLSNEVRARYSQFGLPYFEGRNGMKWHYLPLKGPMDERVCLVIYHPNIRQQMEEALI